MNTNAKGQGQHYYASWTQKLNILFGKQLITKNDRLTFKSQTSHSYAHNKQQNLIYTKRRFKQLRKMVRHFNS